ncbi:hypothetical protein V7S43_004738 [Phytophthora oleae]|uniref:Wings apart-like protein C-terminal domain-containing protein n=1 Tax=Phytophthora oleae TaxID=2107226 RepID=A0ABD3FXP8_9STRA
MAPSSMRSHVLARCSSGLSPPHSHSTDSGASPHTPRTFPASPEPLLSRLEAVDRFALYGRQHAHVDHLSGPDQDRTTILQSTMLLQEDGLLSSRLDDVTYLLDGLLKPVTTKRGRLTQTRSVLELIQLLKDPQILQAMELSSQSLKFQRKVKQLLLSKPREAQDETYRVSMAVLVYFLSDKAETQDYLDDKVLDSVVDTLKQEVDRGEKREGMENAVKDSVPLKKCLKRKKTEEIEDKAGSSLSKTTMQMLEDCCRLKMDELLQDREEFYVEGEVQTSVREMLCAALHNLLQVDGPSRSSGWRQQDQDNTQPDDDTFQRIRARKRQLMRNGGLDTLMQDLAKHLDGLEALLPSTQVEEVTVECARSLRHLNSLLSVFDQVLFLTMDVQQYISRKKSFVKLLLKITRWLGGLSWGSQAHNRWETQPTRMVQAVETLLSALRVLINLTHHNAEAASHLHALDGMQLFADSFYQLWTAEKTFLQSSVQEKWKFDVVLLLQSVMVNSIEFSDENRDVLASYQVDSRLSACDLFVQFFLAKLQSYKHLIELTEVQTTLLIDEDDNWNPEDVILGGCTSLLLGYLMKGSSTNSAAILTLLPDSSPRLLLRTLAVFVAFQSQVGALTPDVAESVLQVEKVLKSYQQYGITTDNVAAKSLPEFGERQGLIGVSTMKDQEMDGDLNSTMSIESSITSQSTNASPPALRARHLKNVCSNLDDSEDENEPQIPLKGTGLKHKGSQTSQALGLRTPTRTPPRSPGRKRLRTNSPMKTHNGKSPSRSSSIAVLPDGSLSSPVVAGLLKRTRQLVEEFDAEFIRLTPTPRRDSREGETATDRSTMDVACRDSSNGLEISEVAVDKEIQRALTSKRRKKPMRDADTSSTSAVVYQASFDLAASSTPRCPQRTKNNNLLLHTPTRAQHSPGLYRPSPSLNLTPTKSSPSTPLRKKKASGLLRTTERAPPTAVNESLSASFHRRKTKAIRVAASTGISSVFDFDD